LKEEKRQQEKRRHFNPTHFTNHTRESTNKRISMRLFIFRTEKATTKKEETRCDVYN